MPLGKKGFQSGGEWNGKRGAPRKPEIQLFRDALAKAEKENNLSLLEHAVKQAYKSENVLIAVLKKILPDLSQDDSLKDIARFIVLRAKEDIKKV